jgi:hypothetical protein
MMEAVRTSETSVDNHFTRQYNPEDSSEFHELLVKVIHIIQLNYKQQNALLHTQLALDQMMYI